MEKRKNGRRKKKIGQVAGMVGAIADRQSALKVALM